LIAAVLFVLVFGPMIVEAAISARNETHLRCLGAKEPEEDVFRAMQVGYPAAFLVMVLEACWWLPPADTFAAAGLAVLVAAKFLKYWAIATLGPRWTFRVLVPPDSVRVLSGPYRYHRHPNYIAVTGELVGAALMAHAAVTGPPAIIGFMLLIRRRMAVEERALRFGGVESRR
jgi:methyltransferase